MNAKIPNLISRAVFLGWGIYFLLLFSRMLWVEGDGWSAGHWFVWGDWPLHIAQITVFAEKPPATWFAYHPVFADGPMTYPFLANLLAGLTVRLGLPLFPALLGQSIALSFLLLWILFLLGRRLTGSEGKAALGASLFFLSAGLGFLRFLSGPLGLPTGMVTPRPELDWFSGNVVVGLLLPQRGFLFGLTLALGALFLLLRGLERRQKKALVAAGLLVGLLPIAHAHSLIALAFLLGVFFFARYREWRLLLWFALPAAALGFLLIGIFLAGGVSRPGFAAWQLGYSASNPIQWILFWGEVWGLMLPAALLGLWLKKRGDLFVLGLGAGALFLAANLIRFQPIPWDNSKLFLWAYLVFAWLSAGAVFWVWEKSKTAAALLVALLTFSGLLELILVQRVELNRHHLISHEELALADQIRRETGPLDRFLTATIHNHPVMVRGGRPILMGYQGWVYNYGLDYEKVERQIALMYAGGEGALALLKNNRIKYVYIGPSEREGMKAKEDFYRSRFPVAFESENIRVYAVDH